MVGARERPRTCTAITEGRGQSWSSENWRPADPMEAERRLMRARNTLGLICRRNILPKVGFKIGEGNGYFRIRSGLDAGSRPRQPSRGATGGGLRQHLQREGIRRQD